MVARNDKASIRYRQFEGGYAQALDSQLRAVFTGYQRGLLRRNEVRVYDYANLNVPMLARMFDRRCRGYEAVGYRILLPASAAPGWPVEVPLPVEPQWKNEYAATVRRLVRDGVDAPLANLFVHAAQALTRPRKPCRRPPPAPIIRPGPTSHNSRSPSRSALKDQPSD